MTELDELEEIDLKPASGATRKQRRAGHNWLNVGRVRACARPRWVRQLSAEKGWAPKRKPGVTA